MTISAPSCERMMSSIPCLSSVPGATRAMEASRRGSRRGSSSEGERVKPSAPTCCLSALSGIQSRLHRVPQRLLLQDAEFATRGGSRRDDRGREAELRAFLEAPLSLGRWAKPSGETDLAERRDAALDRRSLSRRRDREGHCEIRPRLVDANAACDVDEHVGRTE